MSSQGLFINNGLSDGILNNKLIHVSQKKRKQVYFSVDLFSGVYDTIACTGAL